MKPLNVLAIRDAIAFAINAYGIGILPEQDRFLAVVKDYMFASSQYVEKNLLIYAIRVGVGKKLLSTSCETKKEKRQAILQGRAFLSDEHGLNEERSIAIIYAFSLALGWCCLPDREGKRKNDLTQFQLGDVEHEYNKIQRLKIIRDFRKIEYEFAKIKFTITSEGRNLYKQRGACDDDDYLFLDLMEDLFIIERSVEDMIESFLLDDNELRKQICDFAEELSTYYGSWLLILQKWFDPIRINEEG